MYVLEAAADIWPFADRQILEFLCLHVSKILHDSVLLVTKLYKENIVIKPLQGWTKTA